MANLFLSMWWISMRAGWVSHLSEYIYIWCPSDPFPFTRLKNNKKNHWAKRPHTTYTMNYDFAVILTVGLCLWMGYSMRHAFHCHSLLNSNAWMLFLLKAMPSYNIYSGHMKYAGIVSLFRKPNALYEFYVKRWTLKSFGDESENDDWTSVINT